MRNILARRIYPPPTQYPVEEHHVEDVELRQLTTNGLRTLINININYDVGRLRTLMSMIIFMT